MGMSVFAMSLARLYKAKKITDAKVAELLAAQKITAEEAEFITKECELECIRFYWVTTTS